MKKFLLLGAALVSMATATAQISTVQAYTTADENWAPNYAANVELDQPVTVDVYDGYVIIKEWLGSGSNDLKVAFDEDENVTSVTPIVSGVEGKTYTSGYAAFSTNAANYYYVQLYLGESYDYAYADEAGGYVTLSGYFYTDQSTYDWIYYNIEWGDIEEDDEIDLGELKYNVNAKTGVFDEWGTAEEFFKPGTPVGVSVYDNGIKLSGWLGVEGNDLVVQYNEDAAVTLLAAYNNDALVSTAGDTEYLACYTGDNKLYYVNVYVGEGYDYAYVSGDESYVLLSCTFYDTDNNEVPLYYYVEWEEEPTGIDYVGADNAPVEFYNMQGMRINSPASGQLVIKRQGNKAVKTIVR